MRSSREESRVESKQKKQTKKQKHDVEKNEGRYEVAGAALRIVRACSVITVSHSHRHCNSYSWDTWRQDSSWEAVLKMKVSNSNKCQTKSREAEIFLGSHY